MMRSLFFMLLLSVVVIAHAAGKASSGGRIEWTLSLDADGKVEGLKPINPEYLPEVSRQLEPIIRAWHFTPGKVDGHPVATETTLGVRVAFEPESAESGRYRVRIASASTGGTFGHVVAPHYPTVSQKAHQEGAVILWVNYDANGAITSVRNVPEMSADGIDSALVGAAIDAVKKWTFRPETVAGHGIASEVLVPVCFQLADKPCDWKPWPGKRPFHAGEALALSSVVGLDTGDGARQLP
jgi:TonB family protein